MTVAELIAALSNFPPTLEVWTGTEYHEFGPLTDLESAPEHNILYLKTEEHA